MKNTNPSTFCPCLSCLHCARCECKAILEEPDTQCLNELTQLDTLELKDTLPEERALPAGLTSLKLSVDSLEPNQQQRLHCAPVLAQYLGSLRRLSFGHYICQYGNNPAELAHLKCLQQLSHLRIIFCECSAELCRFIFPRLQRLSVHLSDMGQLPSCDLSYCPSPKSLKIVCCWTAGQSRVLDLQQVVDVRAQHLELVIMLLGSGGEAVRAAVNASSWTVGSLTIDFTCESPDRTWQEWMCVRDVIGGVLGIVPLSKVIINGTEVSNFVG